MQGFFLESESISIKYLSYGLYQTVLITVVLYKFLKSEKVTHPTLFIFKTVFVTWFLTVPRKFLIGVLISKNNTTATTKS
jgi:hypothetical protein